MLTSAFSMLGDVLGWLLDSDKIPDFMELNILASYQ
jgi:hypothetical protein